MKHPTDGRRRGTARTRAKRQRRKKTRGSRSDRSEKWRSERQPGVGVGGLSESKIEKGIPPHPTLPRPWLPWRHLIHQSAVQQKQGLLYSFTSFHSRVLSHHPPNAQWNNDVQTRPNIGRHRSGETRPVAAIKSRVTPRFERKDIGA